jgi:hypothetical protein
MNAISIVTHTINKEALTVWEEYRQSIKEMTNVGTTCMPITYAIFWQMEFKITAYWLDYRFHKALLYESFYYVTSLNVTLSVTSNNVK